MTRPGDRALALLSLLLAVTVLLAVAVVVPSVSGSTDTTRAEAPVLDDWGADAPTATPGDAFAGVRYINDVQAATVWLFGVHQAEVARQQAAAAARPRGGSSFVGTAVGECTGFVIPDYIIQRESGGNPNAHNPSGAHGCTQTLLSHYSSGSCQGLDPNTVEGQRECTFILSDGGTNLDAWSATR